MQSLLSKVKKIIAPFANRLVIRWTLGANTLIGLLTVIFVVPAIGNGDITITFDDELASFWAAMGLLLLLLLLIALISWLLFAILGYCIGVIYRKLRQE